MGIGMHSGVERRSEGWEVVGWERRGRLKGNISAKGWESFPQRASGSLTPPQLLNQVYLE